MTTRTIEHVRRALEADFLGKNAYDLGWPDLDAVAAHIIQVLDGDGDTAGFANVNTIRSALGGMFDGRGMIDGRDMRDYGWPNAADFAESVVGEVVRRTSASSVPPAVLDR